MFLIHNKTCFIVCIVTLTNQNFNNNRSVSVSKSHDIRLKSLYSVLLETIFILVNHSVLICSEASDYL